MADIKIVPSMAFDAICFFEHLAIDYETYTWGVLPEQKAFREKIEKLTDKLKGDFLGMSSLCGRISSYGKNRGFENYTLDDLAEFFKNPENIRHEIETEAIWASVKQSPEEWAEKYINYICILKEIRFDKLWESDLLPIIQENIKKTEETYKNLNMDGVFADIQRLKQCEPLEDVKIYIGVMSYPVAFKLHGNSFLTHVHSGVSVGLVCHELMHGFTNKELEGLYLEYIKGSKYLTKQHDKLISEMHSGNEEEFVVAAECYLRMKHNNEDKKDLLKHARGNYGGCMPTSVFLFDLLSQESETPNGYVNWLTDIFKSKKLPQKAIERHLDEVLPKNPWDDFNDKLFSCFFKMLDKAKEIQAGKSFDIEKKIESIVNHKFEDITESIGKSVYFAQERQFLPNALNVKEMCVDNLFINIAEFEDNEKAMFDTIDSSGANITVPKTEINGKQCSPYCVNLSRNGKMPVTSSISFIKDNLRVSFTARCPDYVNRGMDYPANLKDLKEMREYVNANSVNWEEREKELNKNPFEPITDFTVKYADEILSAQKKIEDVIMQL
ncbi:MAG: hypothetical protein FWD71_13815 [Oscillospiraceae bacterium]|nr:hypothetical protein [Oscillospiraceae bacterium]